MHQTLQAELPNAPLVTKRRPNVPTFTIGLVLLIAALCLAHYLLKRPLFTPAPAPAPQANGEGASPGLRQSP